MTNSRQVHCIRELARQVAEIGSSFEQQRIQQRWRNTYMCRPADRAPVWLRPSKQCWGELLPEETLTCQIPFLRHMERELRQQLIRDSFADDSIILPYWHVDAAIDFEGDHLWGVAVQRILPEGDGGAWSYDPPIKNETDMKRLRMPHWYHDAAETDRRVEQYSEVLGDTLPVRLRAQPPLFPGVGHNASDLIGLDALLLNMALAPDMIHELMTFIRDSVLCCQDEVEAMGILTENNDDPIHFSESLKQTPKSVPVKLGDLWLRTESQQFQGVSPDMWREFCLDYQRPIMERFRYVSYGCCENLTDRIDSVLAIPNLKIFVNSPWTDLSTTAQKCGDRFSIVWRQNASRVLHATDMTPIRHGLEEGLKITRGCHRAIVLQELTSCHGNPGRLSDWAETATRAAERCA